VFKTNKKIGIVGGCGHVGLPLSLVLAKKFNVEIIDPSKNKELIKKGLSPFKDPGIEHFLNDKIVKKNLIFSSSISKSKSYFDAIIITMGTPVDEWSNPISDELINICFNSKKKLKKNGLLILRSTVTPGLTNKISKELNNINVCYCPERIVQGKSFTELFQIPQIISTTSKNKKVLDDLKTIFYFAPSFIQSKTTEAELIKLFNNFWRYSTFAISNQMYLISENYKVSFSKILSLMKNNYPRAKEIPGAGLAAGPCLYKDTQQLSAFFPGNFSVGNASLEMNEKIVDYIIQKTLKKCKNKKILILGAAFKADCDDYRSSLSFKILKNLKRVCQNKIIIFDPYVKHPKVSNKIQFNQKKDFFILATPHKKFLILSKGIHNNNKVDIWND